MIDGSGQNTDDRMTNAPASTPSVTIGMPIYNEERFLKEALHSLAAQDYPNLTVIISDNASTDRTGEIAETFARDDDRFVYARCEENVGVAENFRRVTDMTDSKYFMWAAGHDLWSPNLISACVAALDQSGVGSIAVAPSWWIDQDGQRDDRDTSYPDIGTKGVFSRFFTVLWGNMHPVLGLMRADFLRTTRNVQTFAGADLVLLTEMNLRGPFVSVPNTSWQRRDVRAKESHEERMERYTGDEYGQSKGSVDQRFPLLRLPFALVRAIWESPQPILTRVLLVLALLPVMPFRYIAGRRKRSAGG